VIKYIFLLHTILFNIIFFQRKYSFLGQKVKTQDLLWSHFSERFDNVFPIDYVAADPNVREKEPKDKEVTGIPAVKLTSKKHLYSLGMENDGTLHETTDM
jgi:hypothetical protein